VPGSPNELIEIRQVQEMADFRRRVQGWLPPALVT